MGKPAEPAKKRGRPKGSKTRKKRVKAPPAATAQVDAFETPANAHTGDTGTPLSSGIP